MSGRSHPRNVIGPLGRSLNGKLMEPTQLQSGERNARRSRNDAVCILNLLATSSYPAVLIAIEWRVAGIPPTFGQRAPFQNVADQVGCHLATVARPAEGGVEHLLFLSRYKGLPDEAFVDCI